MSSKLRLRIKREVAGRRPSLWIGKKGASFGVIEEAKKQLKRKGIIKIKILKGVMEKGAVKELAGFLANNTSSELVETRGRTLILYKKDV